MTDLEVLDAYDRAGAPGWTDDALIAFVGAAVARPKVEPADSFVLHAPLEVLARSLLLRRVAPEGREEARRRLFWVATTYAGAGEELPEPEPGGPDLAPADAAARLVAALEAGELDDVDHASALLAARADADLLRRLLAPTVARSLAAAAHGSIFLSLLGRVQRGPGGLAFALRGLAHELGHHPDWRLRWFEDPGEAVAPASLVDALLEVPMLGPAGSNFIQPIMSQAEDSGLARRLLSGIVDGPPDIARVQTELSRIAVWSMLQEPGGHAYGWSHCLTMPQAVLATARDGAGDTDDDRAAIAIAATHVVGFRAALGRRDLEPRYAPPEAPRDLVTALAEGPAAAAAFAWHATRELDALATSDLEVELAGRAARHHDAHFAKYTLACLDAAETDPEQRPLYLAAAAFLAGFWDAEDRRSVSR
jgi:hypothetical protein